MLVEPHALDDVDDDVIEDELLDRPISSLRDIIYTYGALFELTFGDDVDEYFPYLTPTEFSDNLGEEETVVALDIDLVDESFEGVTVRRYTPDLVPKLAHSRSGGNRDMDHSITHQGAGDASVKKIAETYAPKRLTRWPNDDIIQEYITEEAGNDAWIIDTLRRIGEDDDIIDDITTAVKNALSEDGDGATLVTVRVKTSEGGEWLWPGDVEVLQDAMRYRWTAKQAEKNDTKPPSQGTGAPGHIIGDDAERLVGTADTPLDFYGSKQREKFDATERSDAWLSHPLSEHAAARIRNASEFLDACYVTAFGLRFYYLPYFQGELTADKARKLYTVLQQTVASDRVGPIVTAYQNTNYFEDLVFHTLEIESNQMDANRVYGEEPVTDTMRVVDVANAHKSVVSSRVFGDDDLAAFPTYTESDDDKYDDRDDSWGVLVDPDGVQFTDVLVRYITTGWYLQRTMRDPLPEQSGEFIADDPRLDAQLQLVRGEAIRYDTLVNAFVEEVSRLEHDEDTDGFPSITVSGQVAQLMALDAVGLLDYDTSVVGGDADAGLFHTSNTQTPMVELEQLIRANGDELDRGEKLDTVIENAPVLAENSDIRGAFLVGVLIGKLSGYQASERGANVSTTVRDEYPVNRMTHRKLQQALTKAFDRINVYASDEDQQLFYTDIVDRVNGAVLHEDIPEWDLSKKELRYWYGVGLTYGLSDSTTTGGADDDDVEESG